MRRLIYLPDFCHFIYHVFTRKYSQEVQLRHWIIIIDCFSKPGYHAVRCGVMKEKHETTMVVRNNDFASDLISSSGLGREVVMVVSSG